MPTDSSIGSEKLLERRLDYAWKYFDSASQRRMQFLNFFVLLVGILANAYVMALKEQLFGVAVGICGFGAACAITFIFLDCRMLTFIRQALDVLETLEREVLFPDGYKRQGPNGTTLSQLGLARLEPDTGVAEATSIWSEAGRRKAKFWIQVIIQGGAAVGFSAGAIFAIAKGCGACP